MADVKFKDTLDRSLFLADVNRLDLMEAFEIPEDVYEGFIKRRRELMTHFKDFQKSQKSKAMWRKHRYKTMRGIRKWNSSLKSKKFHRQLGRFLSTRITENYEHIRDERFSNLKALSSLRTHIYIEGEYYRSFDEDVEHHLMVEYFIPLLNSIEMKLIEERYADINFDELEALLRLVDPEQVQSSLTEFLDDQEHSIEHLYNSMPLDEDLTYCMLAKYTKILNSSLYDQVIAEMDDE